MNVLVFIESSEGQIKKSSLEAIAYAAKLNAGIVKGLVSDQVDEAQLKALGAYGLAEVLEASTAGNALATAEVLAQEAHNESIIIFSKSGFADQVAASVSGLLKASVATNVVSLPDASFTVKRSIFSGKAFAEVTLTGSHKVLSIAKNTIQAEAGAGEAKITRLSASFSDRSAKVQVKGVEKASGDILLTEADIVVSGGRGLKGPEHWGIVLDLAKALKAGTGCSKPVSDMDWRPHHEHVGQTGVKVSPNLYIAIGISGAIQHLAGVSSSKCIVVINKDPEAPFFKAADYGIVGDAFEVVPKLIAAARNL